MGKIIGCAAQLANGKDEVADALAKNLNLLSQHTGLTWTRLGFANAVKEVFCRVFGKTWAFVEEWKRKPEIPEGMHMTVRQALQFIGDGFRSIQSDIWMQIAFRDDLNKILADERYLNEAKYIREHGGLSIAIWRPGYENDDPNGSEAEIKPIIIKFRDTGKEGIIKDWGIKELAEPPYSYFDLFIRNEGTLDDLHRKVEGLIVPYVLKFHGFVAVD